MKTTSRMATGTGLALAALLLGFAAGCGEDAQTDTALGIFPASATVYADGATVYLTAYDPDAGVYNTEEREPTAQRAKASWDSDVSETNSLATQILLPLEWSVVNPGMGRIMVSGGYSAVYESYGPRGQNYVVVRDQAGREGIAVIEQRWQEGDPEETGTSSTTSE